MDVSAFGHVSATQQNEVKGSSTVCTSPFDPILLSCRTTNDTSRSIQNVHCRKMLSVTLNFEHLTFKA